MNQEYWQRQTTEALFPDLIWSRPEIKQGAGKLLIIGGQAQEFSDVAETYTYSDKAGAGIIRVFMPESTRKYTKLLPNIEYAPSNGSGSFSKHALSELLEASAWSDTILLAGNLGKNSETSLLLDNLLEKATSQIIINQDALQSISLSPNELFKKDNLSLVLNFNNLQKLSITLNLETPITSTMVNAEFAQILHNLTVLHPMNLITIKDNHVWVSTDGKVSSTNINNLNINKLSAEASVWTMQNPTKIFQSLTTAAWHTRG